MTGYGATCCCFRVLVLSGFSACGSDDSPGGIGSGGTGASSGGVQSGGSPGDSSFDSASGGSVAMDSASEGTVATCAAYSELYCQRLSECRPFLFSLVGGEANCRLVYVDKEAQ